MRITGLDDGGREIGDLATLRDAALLTRTSNAAEIRFDAARELLDPVEIVEVDGPAL